MAVWKRLSLATVVVLLLVWLGGAILFGGGRDACQPIAGPALRCELLVEAAPEEVWLAFARTGEPRPYYFDAILQAEMHPGGRWRFVTDNRERLLAGGRILELEPPRRFVQTFAAADLDDPPSRITVEIQPADGGARVTLLHDRFGGETATYRRFRRAHPLALEALARFVETAELPWRARIYTAIFKPGMRLATVRAEPW